MRGWCVLSVIGLILSFGVSAETFSGEVIDGGHNRRSERRRRNHRSDLRHRLPGKRPTLFQRSEALHDFTLFRLRP